tara:strand:- start:2041 stop:2403 length:363 start_codon:yes stop_codon:yes gene_type:complete
VEFDIDNIKHVDANEALELENESYIFLDVREQSEWDAGHYKNATFLPMSTMPMGSIEETSLNQEASYVVVCRSGNRSRIFSKYLQDNGITAVNLAGGMREFYKEFKEDVVNNNNEEGEII